MTKRFFFGLVLAISLTVIPSSTQPAASMTAHFIDVGQANATLLEFPCGAMLVDVGTQDDEHQQKLMQYLDDFFARRIDLNRTINTLIITHNHIDHTRSLRQVVETFTVERFVDNGFIQGSGVGGPNWLKGEVQAGRRNVMIEDISDDKVEAIPGKRGLTNSIIDPFTCANVRVLQGRFDENPGWPEGEFENQNNHSLVTKVEFGDASLLFMGDLETDGIELLTDYYSGVARTVLDADVLQVGHHGSHNAITTELLNAVTPRVAVIPVGEWTFGQNGPRFSTFAYGHPRKVAVDLLVTHMARQRRPAKTVKVATKAKTFTNQTITKAVYATGWDGTVRVIIRSKNDITVRRER
jgi:competence protein ComEC